MVVFWVDCLSKRASFSTSKHRRKLILQTAPQSNCEKRKKKYSKTETKLIEMKYGHGSHNYDQQSDFHCVISVRRASEPIGPRQIV